jgi:hypothetical protein
MSNLLTTDEGRLAVRQATVEQLLHRMSRFFHRTTVIAFNNWLNGANFDLSTVIGELNELHDPEVLKLLEAISLFGGLQSSLMDMTFYVSSQGTLTGTGTMTDPFLTPGQALSVLPKYIDHDYRILLQGDGTPITYIDGDLYAEITVRNGTFVIAGLANPINQATGILLDGDNVLGVNSGCEFISSGAGWTSHEFQGSWIRAQNGAAQNIAIPIQTNGIEEIYSRYFATKPAAGDTIDIVYPSITWQVNSLTLQIAEQKNYSITTGYVKIAFANLDINIVDSTNFLQHITMTGTQDTKIWLDFVRYNCNDSGAQNVSYENLNVNVNNLRFDLSSIIPVSFANWGSTSISDDSPGQTIVRQTKSLLTVQTFQCINSLIENVTLGNLTRLLDSTINNSACSGIWSDQRNSKMRVIKALINTSGNVGISVFTGYCEIFNAYFLSSAVHAIEGKLATVKIGSEVQCNTGGIPGYALDCSSISHCVIEQDGSNFRGTSGDILFSSRNPDITALWPNLPGTDRVDSIGSDVVWPG